MEWATRLRAEARETGERRLLVLTGGPGATRERARAALDATEIAPEHTSYVGPAPEDFYCETLPDHEAGTLLGTSREAVIYDCHERCEPTTLGKLVGTIDGGGLFVLLVPPLETWPSRRDGFDDSLAVPPCSVSDVGCAFRRRLIETLETHRGIAIVDAETGTVRRDGLCKPAPRLPADSPTIPECTTFPLETYEACRTKDQIEAVAAFESLRERDSAVVVEADRGRGKSSAAGLAAGAFAADGVDVLVTAPEPANVGPLFARARELLTALDDDPVEAGDDSTETIQAAGTIRYERPAEAAALPGDPDVVFVDEAAAIPVRHLEAMLDARAIAFTTTVRGYEGTGRGFAVRFRERLAESRFAVQDLHLSQPIRFAPADPVEVWAFRALALDARPPVAELIEDATPETVRYREFSTADLVADEHLLREVFGLLVLAHYRTEPNDFARLLDAPNVSVHGLTHDGHVVAVALLAREGGLDADLRAAMYDGERIRGNLVPDVLTSQLRDETAGALTGLRVLRIATHERVRSRGLGSTLLDAVRDEAQARGVDWVGVAYGLTPCLAAFWRANGYQTLYLSTTRNDRSGEHSVVMLDPLTDSGRDLHERHTAWFLQRTPSSIRESLATLRPEAIRAACRTVDGVPALDLSPWEWRHVAGVAHGAAIYETAPRAVTRLTWRHVVAPADPDRLTAAQERLVIRKALQGQSWEHVADAEGFVTPANCRRAFADAVEELVECYGETVARREAERFERDDPTDGEGDDG